MGLTICVSPEAGWSELETFLGATRKRLTVAMYQFTAPHVFKAVEDAVTAAGLPAVIAAPGLVARLARRWNRMPAP